MWVFTVPAEMSSASAIALLLLPSATRRSTWRSRPVRRQRVMLSATRRAASALR